MVRVIDAGRSSWFAELEGEKSTCHVPWWVWQLETVDGEGSRSVPVPLGIGRTEVSMGSLNFSAQREEPLCRWMPWLRSYEVSLISIWIFVIGLIVVLRTGVPSLIAAIGLTLIPVCRICPELPLLCRPIRGRTSRGLFVAIKCCLFLWFVLFLLFRCKGQSPSSAPVAPVAPRTSPRGSPSPKADVTGRHPGVPRYEVEEPEDWIDPPEVVSTTFTPERISPCFLRDAKYEPINSLGQGRTRVRSPSDCQARCSRTRGCAYFTAFPIQPNLFWCHLQEYGASRVESSFGAIAGPGDCGQEAMLQEVLGKPPPTLPPERPTTTEAPPSPPSPRPPIARVSKETKKRGTPSVKVTEDPKQEVMQEATAEPRPNLGADGNLLILLVVLCLSGGTAFSGHLERS